MKRYAAQLEIGEGWPGADQAKSIIERELAKTNLSSHIYFVTPLDNSTVLVELVSAAEKQAIAHSIGALEEKLGMCLKAVGWGWPVSDSFVNVSPDIAPSSHFYATLSPQQTESAKYCSHPLRILGLVLLFLMLAASVYALAVSDNLFVRGSSAIFILLWVSLNTRMASSITCDKEGLEFRRWLMPPKWFAWEEICGLRLHYDRKSCLIHTCAKQIGPPFIIPIGMLGHRLNRSHILIKTILCRSSLLFVEGSRSQWGDATYRRFDTPDPKRRRDQSK